METPRSLAPAWSTALTVPARAPGTSSSASGRLFAEEVERAREQQVGGVREERRRAELEGERRATRRASFGGERAREPEETPRRAPEPRPEAALAARAAPASAPPAPERAREPSPPAPTGAPEAGTSTVTSAAPDAPSAAAPLAAATPAPAAAVPAALATRALEGAPAAAPASAPEAPALAPTTVRAGGARAAPTAAEVAPGEGPHTAVRAEEILRQLELHLAPGVKRLTLELEPLELGRLSIQLALRAGKLSAIVRGERPETLALLEGRAGELARLFAARGIEADEVRFELGFRNPSRARRASGDERASPRIPDLPGTAGGLPGSVDTYA